MHFKMHKWNIDDVAKYNEANSKEVSKLWVGDERDEDEGESKEEADDRDDNGNLRVVWWLELKIVMLYTGLIQD